MYTTFNTDTGVLTTHHGNGSEFHQSVEDYGSRTFEIATREDNVYAFELHLIGTFMTELAEHVS